MADTGAQRADRKQRGAWYTPPDLVDAIVDAVVTAQFVAERCRTGRPISVLDPACGDGRFLAAAARRIDHLGGTAELVGVDIDADALEVASQQVPSADLVTDDALTRVWPARTFDVVVGNPPFLSQLASATTRGRSGARGAGTYGDAAVEFVALGAELVDADGGRLAMVLPQSILASRDAAAVRASVDRRARRIWSWWTGERIFDAQVLTCAVAFEFRPRADGDSAPGQTRSLPNWASVITDRTGVPPLPTSASTSGRLGDRARCNANFRDEYYGLVGAVGDHACGPPLITSGLIDPGRSLWGRRPITFARARYERPRVRLDLLDTDMQRWAERRLVPKVLLANQTKVLEAVCDPDGVLLPGVPVVAVYPSGSHWSDTISMAAPELADRAWEIAAVLTSPYASAWLWHRSAGTGLGADAIRASPVVLADLPWPAGPLGRAVDALRIGDLDACGLAVDAAYGIVDDSLLRAWWTARLPPIR